MEIQLARTDQQILKCWEVMYALRPHLQKENFLPLIKEMMADGYQIAFLEENGKAISAIGFRYMQMLYNGKQFYIDDLSTLPAARGRGFGGELLQFVEDLAREKGYQMITLDSGYQRYDAHRLYLNKGFRIDCHHLTKKL